MKRKLAKLAQVAALGLAFTFTFSCSSSDDNSGGKSSAEAVSSSSSEENSSSSVATVSSSSAKSSSSSVATVSSSSAKNSSSSVEPVEPSILDCPIEDLEKEGKYPLPEFDPPNPGPDAGGWCAPSALEISAEELSFSAQGGVRCVTASYLMSVNAFGENGSLGCREEKRGSKFYKRVCPWFTLTAVDVLSEEGRPTLHISVNKNETGSERETRVGISIGNCSGNIKITQSPK